MFKTRTSEVTPEAEGGARAWSLLSSEAGPTSDGTLAVAELEAGFANRLHRHPNAEETVLVLEGNGTATTAAGKQSISPGSILFAPTGSWHGLEADSPMRLLVIFGGVDQVEDAETEEVSGEVEDSGSGSGSGSGASITHLNDVPDHSAHNPELGFFQIEARFAVDAETTGSAGTVLGQARSAANGGSHALHRHPNAAEFFCLMEGEGVQITADGEEVPIVPGDVTYVAPGEWHGFRNTGDVETRAIFGFFGADSRVAAGYEVKP